jgi:hypothetical protein
MFSALLHVLQKDIDIIEKLSNDKVGSRVHLGFQVRHFLVDVAGRWVALWVSRDSNTKVRPM